MGIDEMSIAVESSSVRNTDGVAVLFKALSLAAYAAEETLLSMEGLRTFKTG
jgi:hypothetical protein